jgi:hypothetical protein
MAPMGEKSTSEPVSPLVASGNPSSPSEQRAFAVQVLATEHFTLQSARAAATMESSSRSALFLTVLSAALVALALAAQVATPREVLLLALLALGIVFFLGLVTYLRVLENGIEDYIYVKEMNRIRHFYVEVAPETAGYFLLSRYDDPAGIRRSMGMQAARRWESFMTFASAVALVNSVVGGVFVAVALEVIARPATAITVSAGAVSAILVALAYLRHGTSRWRTAEESPPARFPTPTDGATA